MRTLNLLWLAIACAGSSHAAELTLASWNLEWLVSPVTAHNSRLACNAGRRAPLPCDATIALGRDSADFARLHGYARALDADVIAFQEVEDAATAQRIFAGYRICIASGAGVQHTGFAVRASIPHRCAAPLDTLRLNARHRAGAMLQLAPGSARQITLLTVHLKSGCASEAIDSSKSACETLRAQGQALGQWITQQLARGTRFVVLGDFNRAGPHADDAFWQQLQYGAAHGPLSAAAGSAFRNCYPGQPYSAYIDHILLSPELAPELVAGSFRKQGYLPLDALRYRLSDHCPVSIKLRSPGPPKDLLIRAD
jgi:endonuclease/exonuclease/phosphatase family metal-dependent hydrolase